MLDFRKIPQKPGVYILKDEDADILYIGKAGNLQKRVKSHFQKGESLFLVQGMDKVKDIDFIITDSENDALILENQLIKKYQPKFNIRWKDDKNYFFVAITKQKFPRVFWTHQQVQKNIDYLGLFVSGKELKNYLFSLRKIFPFRSCKTLPRKTCLWYDLDLCTGVCVLKKAKTTRQEYLTLIAGLKEMLNIYLGDSGRIEAYDISNIGQKFAVGSMVVFEKNKKKKSEYRRFKIKTVKKINDVACLKEIVGRRLKHNEWKMPALILLDGGKGQLNAIKKINVPSIALAKKKRKKSAGRIYSQYVRKGLDLDKLPEEVKNTLLRIRDEAHRFAITYHRERRTKVLINL
jgi:excinuclease UvrABC nuclease subunit